MYRLDDTLTIVSEIAVQLIATLNYSECCLNDQLTSSGGPRRGFSDQSASPGGSRRVRRSLSGRFSTALVRKVLGGVDGLR